jgi:zinc transporter, ZIP family
MTEGTAAALGATAGLTVFLGLPIAKVRVLPRSAQLFANAVATGILLFLFADIMSRALQPVEAALAQERATGGSSFLQLLALLATGVAVGLMSLIYFNGRILGAFRTPAALPSGYVLSALIATGLGLHNFSEGLAIGQSAATGALVMAGVLVIGFALHNVTEGFGIAAPFVSGLAGIVCGGPTTVGTMIGFVAPAPYLQVLFLALAAGALMYVLQELFQVLRKNASRGLMGWGILTGFLVLLFSDLLLTYFGA